MPIGIERFEDTDDLSDPPTSERIIRFLFTHDDQAFTRKAIADAIDANPETVGTNLTRLKNRGLVRHREPYWAFTDDREQALTALRARYDATQLIELVGDDDWDERNHYAAMPERPDKAREEVSAQSGDTTMRTDTDTAAYGTIDGNPSPSTARTSSGPHREAAAAFFERAREHLEDAVEILYLFGSVARDSETATSDVDILAVIADDADYVTVDDQLLDIAYDIQLAYDVPIEVHSIRATEFAARKDRGEPFIRTVVEEGELGG